VDVLILLFLLHVTGLCIPQNAVARRVMLFKSGVSARLTRVSLHGVLQSVESIGSTRRSSRRRATTISYICLFTTHELVCDAGHNHMKHLACLTDDPELTASQFGTAWEVAEFVWS
jgi:hypothetical protein